MRHTEKRWRLLLLFATWMSMGLSVCVVVTAVTRTDYQSDSWPKASCSVLGIADFTQQKKCAQSSDSAHCKRWNFFNTTHSVWVNSSSFTGRRKANLCGTAVSDCEDCHESDELNDVLHTQRDCWYDPDGDTWGPYETSVKLLQNCDRIPDAILWAIAAVQLMGSLTLGGMAVVAMWGLSHAEVTSLMEDRIVPDGEVNALDDPGRLLRWCAKVRVGCIIWIDIFGLVWMGCALLTILVTVVIHHQDEE